MTTMDLYSAFAFRGATPLLVDLFCISNLFHQSSSNFTSVFRSKFTFPRSFIASMMWILAQPGKLP